MSELDLLAAMKADAVQCNKRLRQIIGNLPSNQKVAEIKEAAAKGGRNSHKFGSKRGKNGLQSYVKKTCGPA